MPATFLVVSILDHWSNIWNAGKCSDRECGHLSEGAGQHPSSSILVLALTIGEKGTIRREVGIRLNELATRMRNKNS